MFNINNIYIELGIVFEEIFLHLILISFIIYWKL